MQTGKPYPFTDAEVQKVQKGIIYEQVVEATDEHTIDTGARGLVVMGSVSESIDYLLKKLCSDNTYENPVTNQRFEVRIVCGTESTQERVRDTLTVAANIEPLGTPTEVNEDLIIFQEALDEKEDYYLLSEEMAESNGDNPPTEPIEIHFRVLDTAGIEPPYRVHFLLMPNGTEAESGDDFHALERGQLPTFEPTGSITYTLPQCIQPSVYLTGLALATNATIGTFLRWSDGSNPPKQEDKQRLAPVKLNQVQTLSGRNRVGNIDTFTLSVKVNGNVKYRVEGDYI